jgi:hypothetical protein
MVVNKYALYCGYHYYPDGGYSEFQGFFDTLELAQAEGKRHLEYDRMEWGEIVLIQVVVDGDKVELVDKDIVARIKPL